jgi:thiol-disulfide isomerase/thioredoxin
MKTRVLINQSLEVIALLFIGILRNGVAGTGSLAIKVADEAGKPVHIAFVQLWSETASGGKGFDFAVHSTDTPGTFRVPAVPAGRYAGAKINKPGYAPGWVPDLQVAADRETLVTCTLTLGGTIEGSVTDEAGLPVEGIPVVVNSVLCRRDVVTDKAGRFVAEHLSNTEYSISAEPKADSPYVLAVLDGGAHGSAKDLRLALERKFDAKSSLASKDQDTRELRQENVPADELSDVAARSARLAREALIGKPAPVPIVERWYNGGFWQLNLAHKVVLLDFWGVWCSPCRRQIPQIRDLAAKCANQGLVVIGIHTQAGKENLPSFLAQNEVPYLVAVDRDNKTAEAYRVTGYPTVALIDRKGILSAIDPSGLEKAVEALLARTDDRESSQPNGGRPGSGAASPEASRQNTPERSYTLKFPKNRSLGWVYVQDARGRDELFNEAVGGYFLDSLTRPAWEPHGLAQGDVPVSSGQRVKLIVNPDAGKDLSALTRLAADDLYEISLAGTRADDQTLAALAHLTELRSLDLVRTAITDRGLAAVARLRSLKWLALPEEITDEGLAHLAGLPKLEGLLLSGKSITGSGLVHLRRIPTLRVLSLNGQSALQDASLAPLVELPHLESLSLGNASRITDAGVDLLVKSPALRKLDLFGTQVTLQGVARLTELSFLEHLDLNTQPGLNDEALAALSRLRHLKRLRLGVSRTQHYTEMGLRELTKLEELELLHVYGPTITDAALHQIAKLSGLRELFIVDSPMSNTGLVALASLKSLQVLDLRVNRRLTLGGLAVLNSLTNLRALYAMGGIEDDGARLDIGRLSNLTDLILEVSTRRFRPDDLACLESLTKLRSLQLGGNAVSDDALAHLRGLTNLYRLRIGGPEVTDAGLVHLAGLSQLEDVSLIGNITEAGLRHLQGLKALRTLRLYSSQHLSADAVQGFKQAMPGLLRFEAEKDRELRGTSQRLKTRDPAPSFVLTTLDGSEVRLSDLRGKIVLLYFWATWCGPCVASMPHLKEFHQQASRGEKFVMIGLSLDDSDAVVRRFVENHQLPWRQARIGRLSRLAASYGVLDTAPHYVLIGPDGRIILPDAWSLEAVADQMDKLSDRRDAKSNADH